MFRLGCLKRLRHLFVLWWSQLLLQRLGERGNNAITESFGFPEGYVVLANVHVGVFSVLEDKGKLSDSVALLFDQR
ncbi:MAG: hypothetical protein ACK55Z_22585 [bacterium]